jgi:hypothetical protein
MHDSRKTCLSSGHRQFHTCVQRLSTSSFGPELDSSR